MTGLGLTALVCCDLGGVVRGRAVPTIDLDDHLAAGVGWVPANMSITPLGSLARRTPFDSRGDLRLLPDPATAVRVAAEPPGTPLELVLCDIVETEGGPWECCPRSFLRSALEDLRAEVGARVQASFEHELQLPPAGGAPSQAPFSLAALRAAEPFPALAMGALSEAAVAPERVFAEFAPHQFEIPVGAAEGVGSADRAVVLREVVREVARGLGLRATFTPLLDLEEPGNGVHIHLSVLDEAGEPLLYDPSRPAGLSELGGSFAAGILRHAGALVALTAPSPTSAARLQPHRWSAGAVCLAPGNREALLRIPPVVSLGGNDAGRQLRLEYRAADAAANPYLALGAVVRAGLEGVRAGLPAPPLLEQDPTGLGAAEARRFGVGALPASLGEALEALAGDEVARGWLSPVLYEAYVGVKEAELEAAASDADMAATCRRYAAIY
ncbi:MAG TPA: glutamine synthetase family protein [Solirubrobacteraceae bacterium]|nr:glutamine synthetase family protein [Solirubrobacteraceae bacterium]